MHCDIPLNTIDRGAGLFNEYGIDAILDAASELSPGGMYLGAMVVGIVNLILPSSTGSSVRYFILSLPLLLA